MAQGGRSGNALPAAVSTGVFGASPRSRQEGDLSAQVHPVPEAAASLLPPPETLFEA